MCCVNMFGPLTQFLPIRSRGQNPGGEYKRHQPQLTVGRTRRTPTAQTNPAGVEDSAADGGQPGLEGGDSALRPGRRHRFCLLCSLSVHHHSFPHFHVRVLDKSGCSVRLCFHCDFKTVMTVPSLFHLKCLYLNFDGLHPSLPNERFCVFVC